MSDDTAFLARIIAAPADNRPRLVYADWLEEHGDPRGEFIRVQCELATVRPCKYIRPQFPNNYCHPPYCTNCRDHKRPAYYSSLRCREGELLDRHALQWWTLFGEEPCNREGGSVQWVVDPSDRARVTVFRRGFVAEVTCRLEDWYKVCERCDGQGNTAVHSDGCGNIIGRNICKSCKGTGNVGHGPAIVRSTPLEAVRLSDREPYTENETRYCWYGGTNRVGFHPQSDLPMEVFDILPGPVITSVPTSHRRFASEAEAVAALSDALIRWAKSVS
jgi:uncharacterized protein (TIGR02996 family)